MSEKISFLKKSKKHITEALKALFTGASMLIPGVSGGTMALVLGFYDKLLKSISNIFRSFWKSAGTLLFYVLFVGGGFVLFSGAMSWLTENLRLPVYSFFVGAVLGGLPSVIRRGGTDKKSILSGIPLLIAGIAAVILLSLIPESSSVSTSNIPLLILAGIMIAVALVMPGISFSHMLLVFGIYESVINAVKSFDILYLLPIGIASVAGVLLLAKLLDFCMEKYPAQSFYACAGFAAASSVDIFRKGVLPELAGPLTYLWFILAAAVGFAAIFFLSKIGVKHADN